MKKAVMRHVQLATKTVRQLHFSTLESSCPTVYNWNILGVLTKGKNNRLWVSKNRKEERNSHYFKEITALRKKIVEDKLAGC